MHHLRGLRGVPRGLLTRRVPIANRALCAAAFHGDQALQQRVARLQLALLHAQLLQLLAQLRRLPLAVSQLLLLALAELPLRAPACGNAMRIKRSMVATQAFVSSALYEWLLSVCNCCRFLSGSIRLPLLSIPIMLPSHRIQCMQLSNAMFSDYCPSTAAAADILAMT